MIFLCIKNFPVLSVSAYFAAVEKQKCLNIFQKSFSQYLKKFKIMDEYYRYTR